MTEAEAHRIAIIGVMAEAGKLDKVKAVAAQITAIVHEANADEDGIGDAALGIAALDAAIAQEA